MNPTHKFKKIFYGASDNPLIQFVRYFFVGGFAFIIDFGLLYILTEYAGLHYLGDPLVHSRVGRQLHHQLHLGIQQFEI